MSNYNLEELSVFTKWTVWGLLVGVFLGSFIALVGLFVGVFKIFVSGVAAALLFGLLATVEFCLYRSMKALLSKKENLNE